MPDRKPASGKKPRTQYRFHGVRMLTASHPQIRRLKRRDSQPSIHGTRLWGSSFLVIDYLRRHPPEHSARVLDAGCGWGMAGIYCASRLGSDVISVDADKAVFPYLLANAQANDALVTPLQARFERITKKRFAGVDLLLGADICFWDELVRPIYNMINRALRAGVKKVVIADPGRSPFYEAAERCQERHCAELIDWRTRRPVTASGSLLIIENA